MTHRETVVRSVGRNYIHYINNNMECFLSSTSARTGSFGVILIKNIFAVYVDDFLIGTDSDDIIE